MGIKINCFHISLQYIEKHNLPSYKDPNMICVNIGAPYVHSLRLTPAHTNLFQILNCSTMDKGKTKVFRCDSGMSYIVKAERERVGKKTVCPALSINGDKCGSRVSRLWEHMESVHGKSGSGFYLPPAVRQAHKDVGKYVKQQNSKIEEGSCYQCPHCKARVRRLDKHMKTVHAGSKADWQEMRQSTPKSSAISPNLTQQDRALLDEFEAEFLRSRGCGGSNSKQTRVKRADHGDSYYKRYRSAAAKVINHLRSFEGTEVQTTSEVLCNFRALRTLSSPETGFIDSLLHNCSRCGLGTVGGSSHCKSAPYGEHRPLAPWTVREYLIGACKFLNFLSEKHLDDHQEGLNLVEKARQRFTTLEKSLEVDIEEHQRKVNAKKAEFQNDETENYYESAVSRKADGLLEEDSGLSEGDLALCQEHTQLSLYLENHGRNSEVRCMTLEEAEEATIELGEDGRLKKCIDVVQTKTRKAFVCVDGDNVERFANYLKNVRPNLGSGPFVFPGKNGRDHLSSSDFSRILRRTWKQAGCSPTGYPSQSLLRSFSRGNVAEFSTESEKTRVDTKMCHSRKTAKKYYEKRGEKGAAMEGLEIIRKANLLGAQKKKEIQALQASQPSAEESPAVKEDEDERKAFFQFLKGKM